MGFVRRCKRHSIALCILLMVPLSGSSAQEAPANTESRDTVCVLDSGKQISAHFVPSEAAGGPNPVAGKVWTPGGSAMTLFSQTELKIGNTVLPIGAYTMYLIPGKKDWTVIVSRNQKINAPYNQNEDLVRQPMQTATLPRSEKKEKLSLFFGHVGPGRCELNVSYGTTRAWVEFAQTQ
jgi:hypothetical protein